MGNTTFCSRFNCVRKYTNKGDGMAIAEQEKANAWFDVSVNSRHTDLQT